jgi:hypothetical protein
MKPVAMLFLHFGIMLNLLHEPENRLDASASQGQYLDPGRQVNG